MEGITPCSVPLKRHLKHPLRNRKEGCLGLAFALHIAHKKDALAFTRKSSHLFSDGQESFVTVCFWSRFDRSHHRLQKGAPS